MFIHRDSSSICYSFFKQLQITRIISTDSDPTQSLNKGHYSNHVQNRVSELGLSSLLNEEGDTEERPDKIKSKLAHNLLSLSPKIQWKLGKFNRSDVKNATDYLELFILYAAQVGQEHLNPEDICKLAERVFKSVKNLEEINIRNRDIKSNSTKTTAKLKKLLKPQVSTLERRVYKILAENISESDQLIYQHDIYRALKILKSFVNS